MNDKRSDTERRDKIDRLIAMEDDLVQLVQLLKDLEGAFKTIKIVGNSVKWLASIIIVIGAAWAAWTGLTK